METALTAALWAVSAYLLFPIALIVLLVVVYLMGAAIIGVASLFTRRSRR